MNMKHPAAVADLAAMSGTLQHRLAAFLPFERLQVLLIWHRAQLVLAVLALDCGRPPASLPVRKSGVFAGDAQPVERAGLPSLPFTLLGAAFHEYLVAAASTAPRPVGMLARDSLNFYNAAER